VARHNLEGNQGLRLGALGSVLAAKLLSMTCRSMSHSLVVRLCQKGDVVKVVAYNAKEFGFLRLTVDINRKTVIGEFFSAYDQSNPGAGLPVLSDSFTLHLQKHTID
jgi:hypothetical protein